MLLRLGTLLLLIALAGCASAPLGPQRPQAYASVEISEVPFYPQQRFQCGPASLTMVLNWGGLETDPERLTDLLYVPAREGSLQPELQAQARRHGRLAYRIPGDVDALLTELEAGHPVLVLQNLALRWTPVWHYAVVIGFDAGRRELILRSGTDERHTVGLRTFLRTWARGNNWGLVVLPPGQLPATARADPYLSAAFELERSGQAEAARIAYRSGVAHWEGHAGLSLALANLEYARGELLAAAAILQNALDAGADDSALYNNLAVVLSELGRWQEAEAAAKAALARGDGHDAKIHSTLQRIRCRGVCG